MQQYQKHIRNATLSLIYSCLLLIGVTWIAAGQLQVAQASLSNSAIAPKNAPASGIPTPSLILVPSETTSAKLLTHTADITLVVEPDGSLIATTEAHYRLHNPNTSDTTVALAIFSDAPVDEGTLSTISVAVDGQSLPLTPGDSDSLATVKLEMAPDARRDVVLRYETRLDENHILQLRYPVNQLTRWSQTVNSWRVTIQVPLQIAVDSWLQIKPNGWKQKNNAIEWLQETSLPDEPVAFQFVQPTVWAQINDAQTAIETSPVPSNFARLGNLFLQLYQSPSATGDIRERLYSQTLAVFSEGVKQGEAQGSSPQELAPLHVGLATLYRSRSVDAQGQVIDQYINLMIDEIDKALEGLSLPEQQNRRNELTQWLADGLVLQARQAQSHRDWQTALSVLDRMALLPPGFVDPQMLTRERRNAVLQQAITLLGQGNQEAAIALAGPEISADNLAPPTDLQSLFSGWRFSATISPGRIELLIRARPTNGRSAAAQAALEQIFQQWKTDRISFEQAVTGSPDNPEISIKIVLDESSESRLLVKGIPATPDFVLLRTALLQIDPRIEQQKGVIWETVTVQQEMDLRSVADQWLAMAASLEREAAKFEAGNEAATSSSTEDVIANQIRAVYYRNAASNWRSLVNNSQVLVELHVPSGSQSVSRAWAIDLLDPPQTLSIQAQRLLRVRLILAGFLGLLFIIALAGVLWFLL
jgi:molybdopterin converting factor small subunit